jgi:hypothetical protein
MTDPIEAIKDELEQFNLNIPDESVRLKIVEAERLEKEKGTVRSEDGALNDVSIDKFLLTIANKKGTTFWIQALRVANNPGTMMLSLAFQPELRMPRDAKPLYNLLECLDHFTKLGVRPDKVNGEIWIHSIESSMMFDPISNLSEYLAKMIDSMARVQEMLTSNAGLDYWSMTE